MYETKPPLNNEFQDVLMCDSFFDNFAAPNNLNNNPNTTQPPSVTLSEFEALQAMLGANNENSGQNQLNSPNNATQDFDNFQYSDNSLFNSPDTNLLASLNCSPESFLNSYNSFDDLSTPSPPQFILKDFIDNDIIKGSIEKPNFDSENAKKRVNSSFNRDSLSPDKSLKKKRNGGIGKPIKKSSGAALGKQTIKDERSSISDILEQFVKNKPALASNILEQFIKSESTSDMLYDDDDGATQKPTSSNILEQFIKSESTSDRLYDDSATQSIIVPSSPVVPSSPDYATMLTWNQTVNPSTTSLISDGSQYANMPLFVRDDGSSTSKLPINRLKSTITNTKKNLQSQPNNRQKKVAHNAIERRYRNNINDRINDLKNVVPALCHLRSKDNKDDDDIEEVDGIPAAKKLNKATILRKATEYITYLKSNNQNIKRENETLKKLIESLPGGVEIYNAYMNGQADDPNDDCLRIPSIPSPSSSFPNSPNNQDYVDYNSPLTPPTGDTGSRALMAIFMFMTFFTSPSSYFTQSHSFNHHEGRVLTSTPKPELNTSDGTLTIDPWYMIRIFTFLLCLTYILRPSLFSSQSSRLRKSSSVILPILSAKIKDSKALYRSLSCLSDRVPVNTFEIIIGLISEFIKFSLRRFIRWDITSRSLMDYEGRFLEVALWGRIGEVELCGGNDNVSRLSILYTCLRTINLMESPYTTRKYIYFNSSRIYANAALQSYIGLSSLPFLAKRVASHFWKLANKERVRNSDSEEKWLEIALNSDQQNDMWKGVVNRINDYILKKTNEEKLNIELMKNITVPLTLITDVQAMVYLKQAFYDFISLKFNHKSSRNQRSFSFLGLVRNTTPNSFTHWYSLVGSCMDAFFLGHNVLGENFINKLRDYPTIVSDENNYDKQIIAMGLLAYALLMHGKLEASMRCANKASIALTKRKEQRNGDDNKLKLSDELNDYSFEIEQDINHLTEFCVGWIVLEVKILGWKNVEELSSASKNSTNSSDENETTKSPSDATTKSPSDSTTATSTNKLPNKLPNLLNSRRLQNAIILWTRYLRRLSKNPVFEDIAEVREIFIKKLVILERVVSGDQDFGDELYSSYCEAEDGESDNTSQSSSECEDRAIKSWNVLKKI